VLWKRERGAPYVATPLLDQGNLWIVKDGGIVTKLSSPVSADGKIFFAGENGVVTIVANESDWRVISTRDFREKIYATPLVSNGCLFIRTARALYCFRTPEKPKGN
jgi:outer membrane protein assembly factor BamB